MKKMIYTGQDLLFCIDTHFHVYKQFDLQRLLDFSCKNLYRGSKGKNHDLTVLPVVVLADDPNYTWFQLLDRELDRSNRKSGIGWSKVEGFDDENGILLSNRSSQQLFVIRGCQLVSQERLEVLVVGRKVKSDSDRWPVDHIIRQYKDDTLVILPWGAGKWLGKCGRIINQLIDSFQSSDFALGDNGGRPGVWKQVLQFDKAREAGYQIFPGSDPLPLKGEEKKAGSYGLRIKGVDGMTVSADSVCRMLKSAGNSFQVFGQLETTPSFIINQLRLRMR